MSHSQESGKDRRMAGGRKQKPVLLVLGDGKSEASYFEQLTMFDPCMAIRAKPSGVTGLAGTLKEAKDLRDRLRLDPNKGDRVAIVMDLDDRYSKSEIERMAAGFKEEGMELYLSNPCFEVWLIQHHRQAAGQGDCKKFTEDLNGIVSEASGRRRKLSR